MKIPYRFIWLWAASTLAELSMLLLGESAEPFRWISKPMIVGSLLLAWLSGPSTGLLRWGITVALVFSLVGDVLLLPAGEVFFQAGLGSFLVAQLAYAYTFYRTLPGEGGLLQRAPYAALGVVAYAAGFGAVLWPHLGGLKVPVGMYIGAISAMALAVLHRGGRVPEYSFRAGLGGMLFFLLSDSLLGYQTFVRPLPLGEAAVMATYAVAQLFLVEAAFAQHTPTDRPHA